MVGDVFVCLFRREFMDSFSKAIGVLFIFSFSLFLGAFMVAKSWDVESLKNQLEDCQKDLPRSQKCILVAVKQVGEK